MNGPGRKRLAAPPTAYERALARLSRRGHSESELRRALLERGHAPEEVEAALGRLRSERCLDDGAFAESYARSRLASHGLGRQRIREGLRRRGVERPVAEEGLKEALRDVSEAEVLEALARRYWRQHGREEPARRLRKLWAFLLRRGFPAPLVDERLRALWPRWSDALEGLEPPEPEEDGGSGVAGVGEPWAAGGERSRIHSGAASGGSGGCDEAPPSSTKRGGGFTPPPRGDA